MTNKDVATKLLTQMRVLKGERMQAKTDSDRLDADTRIAQTRRIAELLGVTLQEQATAL